MSVYRNIYTSFWNDARVDSMTAAEKGVFMYLLTSPLGNLCGCYEIGLNRVSHDTGYLIDTVSNAIANLENKHGVIAYDSATYEVLVRNFSKYNWSKSPKIDKAITDEISAIKSDKLREIIIEIYNNCRSTPYRYPIDTLSIPYQNPNDTLSIPKAYSSVICVTDTDTYIGVEGMGEGENSEISEIPKQVIDYLNEKAGKHYRCAKAARKHINARMEEGYGLADFKAVIDNRCGHWLGTDMEQYLRPETLFGTKFEGYLNSPPPKTRDSMYDLDDEGWMPEAASW